MDEQPESSAPQQNIEGQQAPQSAPGMSCLTMITLVVAFMPLLGLLLDFIGSILNSKPDAIDNYDFTPMHVFFRFFALLQPVALIAGLIALAKFGISHTKPKNYIPTVIGILVSLIFGSSLIISIIRENREYEKVPESYHYDFYIMNNWLTKYHILHGKYPPSFLPYWALENYKEARDRFPTDYYSKERENYYTYDSTKKQWLHNGKPMKDFSGTPGCYRYFSDGKGYIIIGKGPDGDVDLDAKESFLAARHGDMENLIKNKYDPTNGTNSGGDYWVLKLK